MAELRTHRVPLQARGERLDQFLARAFPDITRSRLKSLIEAGRVRVGEGSAKPALRLLGGEAVILEIPDPVSPKTVAEDLALTILYQDQDLAVVDKAPGMAVHPGAGRAGGTLVNALLHHLKDLAGVGGELRPGIVHRLDKDTSGCLVVAKNEPTLVALQRAFKAREVDKTYLALVHGHPPVRGSFETLYGRHPVHRQRFSSKVSRGKRAVTRYRVVEAFDGAALVEVALETGRTHQIRVHFADAGFPLLGDRTYGRGRKAKGRAEEAALVLGRQGLHAWKLAFVHPRRVGTPMTFEASWPDDFAHALEVLRSSGT